MMKIARISAVAFAFAFSVGIASASQDCTMEAASACAETAKQTVANVSTEAKAEGCGACVCPAGAKATETIAEAGSSARSIPGGGMEVVQTNWTAGAPAAAEGSMTKVEKSTTKVKESVTEVKEMPKTKKVGYELGDKVENFKLVQAQTGEKVSLEELAGEKATVIIFWNQQCPWVEGGPHAAGDRVREMAKEYADKGVSVIGIDPGADKAEEVLLEYASTQPFPILVNRDSSMAARFNAQYTPHTFVLDENLEVQYQGGFDSGARRAEDGNPVPWAQNAVDAVLSGSKPEMATTRGTGCSIKWAPGSRPTT